MCLKWRHVSAKRKAPRTVLVNINLNKIDKRDSFNKFASN